MRVLVTGGSGRIGSRIMDVLAASGHEPIDFDVIPPKKPFGFLKGTITDKEQVQSSMKGIDAVIHLAAFPTEASIPTYPEGWEVNCTGTFNVFNSAVDKGISKIVYASSICASGILTWSTQRSSIKYFPVNEEHSSDPQNLYGVSKLISEKLAKMYSKRSKTVFTGLRIATVWLDEADGKLAESSRKLYEKYAKDPRSVLNTQQGSPSVNVNSVKDLTWQYVALTDAATAFRLALEKKDMASGIYNIGAIDTCSDWSSLKLAKTFYPDVPIRDSEAFTQNPKKALWDISKAQKELSYKPEFNWARIVKSLKQ
ncbi:hypothetical protein A3K79_03475 [Candidatus Bathyarchaeota archaeon RBG_13_46_16b]|nr:MAG: hypothetical protein A3K79_03475 [Candidatus Bathyarchaeota archaeon RBG_13_46_16b]